MKDFLLNIAKFGKKLAILSKKIKNDFLYNKNI